MNPLVVELRAPRAVFGADALAHAPAELARVGVKRALLIASPSQRELAECLASALSPCCADVLTDVRMHVPVELVERAFERLTASGADGILCVGGGSAIGLAKALVLRRRMPIVAVPTTYAGSEATSIHGITHGGEKRTGRDPAVVPKAIVYDPALTFSLSAHLTVTSGLNALAHALEALYAHDTNPLVTAVALEAVRALVAGLPAAKANPHDRAARQQCQYGAYLCGVALGNVAMSLHHKACHVLGGSFGLPHAEVHSVVLPYALAYNAPCAPQLARVSALLAGGDVPDMVRALAATLGAPLSLREIGMRESDLDSAAKLMCSAPYPNPRTLDPGHIRAMLQDAYTGAQPRSALNDNQRGTHR